MRISKVVTKTGDKGETGLGDGSRVSKDDPRIACIGALDELNSFVGFAKVAIADDGIKTFLEKIQKTKMQFNKVQQKVHLQHQWEKLGRKHLKCRKTCLSQA